MRIIKSILVVTVLVIGVFAFYYWSVVDQSPDVLMPVAHANRNSYDQHSFGAPRVGHTHKGVDIFAKKGTSVISATDGIVIFTGILSLGGKVVAVLSSDFKFFYYAHLDTIMTNKLKFVSAGEPIGRVGNTGNAKYTPAHLHFSVCRFSPYKRFFDPVPLLNKCWQ